MIGLLGAEKKQCRMKSGNYKQKETICQPALSEVFLPVCCKLRKTIVSDKTDNIFDGLKLPKIGSLTDSDKHCIAVMVAFGSPVFM